MNDLDRTLSALADPARRAVVERLRLRPHRAGELAAALDLPPPTMSRHLRVLRATGLVEERHGGEDARVRLYRLRPQALGGLRRWLDDVERFWTLQLESFRRHAEGAGGRNVR